MEDKGTPPATPGPGRTGYYVRQPEGYRAFIPKPLPPDPPVDMGPEMHALLSRADQALGRLDGSVRTLPHKWFIYRQTIGEMVK